MLIINTQDTAGFDIALRTTSEEITLYLDGFHEHFDKQDSDDVLQLIVYALSGSIRVEVHSKNGHDYKWVLRQKDDKGDWCNYRTTAILNLRFWIRSETKYLVNQSILKDPSVDA